jgi:DNA polymerase III delta subunit
MIYLLVGPDRYLLERELKRILAELDPDNLSTTRYDKSASIGEVSSAVATSGFFGSGRVIVAEGVMTRASGAGKAKKTEAEEIEALFKSVAPGNTLILVDPELGTIPAAMKKAAGSDAIQFGGRVPRGSDLVEWVQGQVSAQGGHIERRNVQRMLDRLFPGSWQEANRNPAYDNPPDLLQLSSEIAKLITAADGKEINARHIDALVPQASQEDLFPFIDAVVSGNATAAFKLLSGEETDDDIASRYLNQLGTNAELGQAVAEVRSEIALADAGKQLGGAKPNRLAAIQRTFARTDPRSFADVVIEADRRLKTGKTRSPSEQLQEIIVRQASKTRGR